MSHKGNYVLGNSKFPGYWSCCSKSYDSQPCTAGEHNFIPLNSAQAQNIINCPLWPDQKALY